jgi:glycerophosphoryl diester phosphodiesterase
MTKRSIGRLAGLGRWLATIWMILKNSMLVDGQKIPLLHEVLDLADKSVAVNIELKGAKTAKPVAAEISKYLNNHGWNEEQFLVSSVSKKGTKII